VDGFTLLVSGYGAIEGPAADDDGGLYFSDVPNGGVYRLAPNGQVDVVIPRRKSVGGIILHIDGGIVVAGRDISRVADGHTEVLLSRTDLPPTPHPVSGFNDMCADADGRIFAGAVRRNAAGGMGDSELVMIDKPGVGVPIYHGIGLPNGAATSPDGHWLYHADTDERSIAVIDLWDPSGTPSVSRRISTAELPGGPDGLAIDVEGGLWVAFYQGGCIARLSPDGTVERRIEVPANEPLNVCFIGPDLSDLIVVTQDNTEDPGLAGSIFRTSVGVSGVPAARVSM